MEYEYAGHLQMDWESFIPKQAKDLSEIKWFKDEIEYMNDQKTGISDIQMHDYEAQEEQDCGPEAKMQRLAIVNDPECPKWCGGDDLVDQLQSNIEFPTENL